MSLKQRLIGATVLIALAVIFVPMFLDGAGHREQSMQIDIPPEPEFEFEKRLPPLSEIGSESFDSIDVQEPVSSEPGSPHLPPEVVKAPAAVESDASEKAPSIARSSPPPPPPPPKAQAKPEAKTAPSPRTIHHGWVVQVGSFKLRSNAQALGDKLKAAGYRVIEERGGTRSIPVYRVKVGPVEKRDRASVLLAKLRKEQLLEGYVTQFP